MTHGWIENMASTNWITAVRDAYNDKGLPVILIDWRRGNGIQYWQASANLRIVGAMVGKAIMNWNIHDRTLLVGFSLGAQVVGEAGKYTQVNGGVKIDECHGLDPAGPFFDGCDKDVVLDKTDCRLVQIIHTSAEPIQVVTTIAGRLGTKYKSGHCDYWVNCGHEQQPCTDIQFLDLIKGLTRLTKMSDGELASWVANRVCSHWRAPLVYLSAIRQDCQFRAYPCPDCQKNPFCLQTLNKSFHNNTLIPFGQCSPDKDENYYVESGNYSPHCDAPFGKKNKGL